MLVFLLLCCFAPYARSRHFGNPSYYACFFDEGLNRVISDMAAASHSHNLEMQILTRLALSHTFPNMRSP